MVILEINCYFNSVKPNHNFNGKVYQEAVVEFICSTKDDLKSNHRLYEPAIIWYNGNKDWYFNGKFYGRNNIKCKFYNENKYDYNQKKFIKNLNKQWLL